MDDIYRSSSEEELTLSKKLLERFFPGRDELLGQLDGLLVKTIDAEGSLSLQVNSVTAPAEVKEAVVAEGYYSDEDVDSNEGPQVQVLLHVLNGRLSELEIYKDDGSPIKKRPLAQNLILG